MRNYTRNLFNSKKASLILLLLVAVLAFTGCKKDDPEPVKYTNVKFFNAVAGAPALDFYIDEVQAFPDVAFGTKTDNKKIEARSHKIVVTHANTRTPEKIAHSYNFTADNNYSFFAIGTEARYDQLVVADTIATPTSGKAFVRFLNISPDNNTYFITTETGTIQFAPRGNKGITSYKEFDATSHDFKVLESVNGNTATNPDPITFQPGIVYTLVLSGSANATGGSTLKLTAF